MLNDPIIALEEELALAMLMHDLATFDRLMDNARVVTIETDAVTETMADVTLFKTGRLRFSRLEASEQHVVRHPDSAVVSSKLEVAGTVDGKPFSGALRCNRAWRKLRKGWRVVSVHVSPAVE